MDTTGIKQTKEGYKVKDLKFNRLDNIIVGLVQDPICGRPELRDGYVSCNWRTNGSVTSKFGGNKRIDLYLDMSNK